MREHHCMLAGRFCMLAGRLILYVRGSIHKKPSRNDLRASPALLVRMEPTWERAFALCDAAARLQGEFALPKANGELPSQTPGAFRSIIKNLRPSLQHRTSTVYTKVPEQVELVEHKIARQAGFPSAASLRALLVERGLWNLSTCPAPTVNTVVVSMEDACNAARDIAAKLSPLASPVASSVATSSNSEQEQQQQQQQKTLFDLARAAAQQELEAKARLNNAAAAEEEAAQLKLKRQQDAAAFEAEEREIKRRAMIASFSTPSSVSTPALPTPRVDSVSTPPASSASPRDAPGDTPVRRRRRPIPAPDPAFWDRPAALPPPLAASGRPKRKPEATLERMDNEPNVKQQKKYHVDDELERPTTGGNVLIGLSLQRNYKLTSKGKLEQIPPPSPPVSEFLFRMYSPEPDMYSPEPLEYVYSQGGCSFAPDLNLVHMYMPGSH